MICFTFRNLDVLRGFIITYLGGRCGVMIVDGRNIGAFFIGLLYRLSSFDRWRAFRILLINFVCEYT